MSESQTEPQKIRTDCYYRVNTPLCIQATGQWIPAGVIADLSDCKDASLRSLLRKGAIETADPSDAEPLFNKAVGAVTRKPCPCNK